MLRVGLTGGIASGKSQILAGFAKAGLIPLDLDRIAHELMARGGAAYAEVVAAFGPGILTESGGIDRKVLGRRVFAEPDARTRLNAIVHPKVRVEEARRVRALAPGAASVVVTDAALLIETGSHLRFDRIVVVDCGREEQLRRLMARDGLDAASATARLEAQMPAAEKRRFAHFIIDSSGALDATRARAGAVARELLELAAQPPPPITVGLERAREILPDVEDGPRGLTPLVVLQELARSGLELEALRQRLSPPAPGPWYRAAQDPRGGPYPAALMAPLALWASRRRGHDPEFLALAATSLARLTHDWGPPVADAVLTALVLLAALAHAERVPPRTDWSRMAERWGGAPPSEAALEQAQAPIRRRGAGAQPGAAQAAALRQLLETDPG